MGKYLNSILIALICIIVTAVCSTFFYKKGQENAWELAKQIVMDGEGATKFVEVNVKGANSVDHARRCAKAIANSMLCKTAWFGADPIHGATRWCPRCI